MLPVVVVVLSVVVVSSVIGFVVVVVEHSSSQRLSPLMQVSQVSSREGQSLNKMQRGFGDLTE